MGSTYVLETDTTETPKFQLAGTVESSAVERPAGDQREERATMSLADAAEWLAAELRPHRVQPAPERRPLCMSDGLHVPERE